MKWIYPSGFDIENWRCGHSSGLGLIARPAIYLLVDRRMSIEKDGPQIIFEILYAGQSKNLKHRIESHDLFRELKRDVRYEDVVPTVIKDWRAEQND